MRLARFAPVCFLATSVCPVAAQETLTYPDLVRRLYDLEYLATPPSPGERSGSFSSFDRRARYDANANAYEDWEANSDGSGYIRKEGNSIVAFEADGPGVIWRVWSALAEDGDIRVFVDGEKEPAIHKPFRDFFERFGTDVPPLNLPELAPTLSRGRNRFMPIPYNRHCKILLDDGWGRYYHITYTTFAKGTVLPTFDGSYDRKSCIALATADRFLSQRGRVFVKRDGDATLQKRVMVEPNTTKRICQIDGPRAITLIRVRGEWPEEKSAQARVLRELTVSMKWDGETQPSVWSPLGDFFGTAPGVNYYRGLPLGMTEAGFYSAWYMPFARNGIIELTNDGTESQTVEFSITHAPLTRAADRLLRFHAKWHRDASVERSRQRGRRIDWPILFAAGGGRYCGMHLHVWNRWSEPPSTPKTWWYGEWDKKTIDWWWGEGDEKFFVDGENFPSTFGTGSEDYIGYAWSAEPPFPLFDSPFASQPWTPLTGNGHTSVNRFQIADNVPFTKSFEAVIEKYKPNVWQQMNHCLYDCTAYWYQRPGETDPYSSMPLSERVGYYEQPKPRPRR